MSFTSTKTFGVWNVLNTAILTAKWAREQMRLLKDLTNLQMTGMIEDNLEKNILMQTKSKNTDRLNIFVMERVQITLNSVKKDGV